jgi:sigma-54 dependent transcriptional regulator, acetoin dehydrogenase operon transcriptional activator AcoR
MTLVMPRSDRHADHVFDVVRGAARDEASDLVARSWSRCLNEYRLHPDWQRSVPVLEPRTLEERLSKMADVVDCARYEMTSLYQQLADDETAVVLTDTDGVILHMVTSGSFAEQVGPMGLRVGAEWSENAAGTNGMGTCLASAAPVAVRREDHFFTQFTGLTCSAVPVYDPAGEMCAVLDVSSRSSLMQQHLLVLLGMTARMIENRLIDQRFRSAHPLHFHSRPEFVYTLHEGRLAVSEDGRVLAANRSALFQLGLTSVAEIRARRVEDLFQSSLDDMVQRSAASSFHPIVTYRANAAHRFFAVARRPAEDARGSGLTVMSASGRGVAVRAAHAATTVVERTPAADGPTFADPRLASQLTIARRVVARQTPILLHGETGAGKEVFARAVHEASPHRSGAFVAINCASLPESLIESELFGYRAGAFTGAQRTGRRGKILQAHSGTLFLDEIGDMPLDLQARLLRVLEERQVTPLGTEEVHDVDFQLLSASHRDLLALVDEGRFRADLYYRLAGVELTLPPLRERADRRELIHSLLLAEGGSDSSLTPEAERALMNHPWPGNVRQLRHVLRSAAALADGEPITLAHLPSLRTSRDAQPPEPVAVAGPVVPVVPPAAPEPDLPKLNPIQANERQVLLQLLEHHRWNVSNVAKALDVSRNTLYRKLHKLHIQISHPD